MKVRRIGIVVLIGYIVLVGLSVVKYGLIEKDKTDNNRLLENGLVWIDCEEDISGKQIEKPEYNPGVYFSGTLLPYDKNNGRLYLPQNYGEAEWHGKLTALIDGEDHLIYILRDEMINQKKEAISGSHDFILYVQVNSEEYYRFLLTITGMPMISIKTDYEVEAEEIPYEVDPDKKYFGSETRYYGGFLMFDPGVRRDGQYQITETAICCHYKGASTNGFEKKSYSFDLLDYRGEEVNVSLAGMRSDNKWKLNSLYTDENRIREITASQIWELIDEANDDINESGPNMEYVELIIDNDYKGIYCLVEPIDAKKMDLQEQDILYKVIDWKIPSAEKIQQSVNNGWKIQSPVRIRYPKEISDYQAAWFPIDDYLNMFYRDGGVQYEEAVKHINLDNFCDMLIFTMVVSGSDNAYKNTFYVSECSDGIQNYQMKQIPWDLDYTFGNIYCHDSEKHVEFDADYQEIYTEQALIRLYEENPKEIAARLNEKWKNYRNDFLDTDRIIALLEKNRNYLLETGAFMREQERWPQSGVDMDIDYLKEFQNNRMNWLDHYFESLFGY